MASGEHYATHSSQAQSAKLEASNPMLIKRLMTPMASKMVLAMVGLPARGKSFISFRVAAFYNWMGFDARVFNVGNHRRNVETAVQDASYFDPDNQQQQQVRDQLALEVLQSMLEWLDERPQAVAIFDATNSTVTRRRRVHDAIKRHNAAYNVVFIESRCSDPDMLETNINSKISRSPDYADMAYEDARRDFMARVDMYRRAFEPIGSDGREEDLSYIKMLNLSMHLDVHKVYGRMTTSLLPYLMALHIGCRPVWLIAIPEVGDRRSTVATPTHAEKHFVTKLGAYIKLQEEMATAQIFACTAHWALNCAATLSGSEESIFVHPALNAMDRGVYEGLGRDEFEEGTSAEFYARFRKDPINTRFPGGECYGDVLRRLMPVVVEIEQTLEPVVVVAPTNVLQVLHCYFVQSPVKQASEVEFPAKTVVELRPRGAAFARRTVSEADIVAAVGDLQTLPVSFGLEPPGALELGADGRSPHFSY